MFAADEGAGTKPHPWSAHSAGTVFWLLACSRAEFCAPGPPTVQSQQHYCCLPISMHQQIAQLQQRRAAGATQDLMGADGGVRVAALDANGQQMMGRRKMQACTGRHASTPATPAQVLHTSLPPFRLYPKEMTPPRMPVLQHVQASCPSQQMTHTHKLC